MSEKCFASTCYRRTPKTNVLVGQLRAFRNITFWTALVCVRGSFTIPPVRTWLDRFVKQFRCRSCALTAKKSCPGKVRSAKIRENAAVRPLFSPQNRLLKLARYVRWPNPLIKTAAQSQDRRESFSRGPGTPVSHLFNVGGRSGGVRTKALLVTLDSR